MADSTDQSGDRDRERMGRGVHEGLNAGVSRNAHDSGSRSTRPRDAAQGAASDEQGADASRTTGESGRVNADDEELGRGGYGNDTGFTGGTRGSREGVAGGDADEGRGMQAAPGTSGAQTEDTTRSDGVGKQAGTGMPERESSAEPR